MLALPTCQAAARSAAAVALAARSMSANRLTDIARTIEGWGYSDEYGGSAIEDDDTNDLNSICSVIKAKEYNNVLHEALQLIDCTRSSSGDNKVPSSSSSYQEQLSSDLLIQNLFTILAKYVKVPLEIAKKLCERKRGDAHMDVLLNTLWLLVKMCRQSLDKSSTHAANVAIIRGDANGAAKESKSDRRHYSVIFDMLGAFSSNEQISYCCCWLIMILASDSTPEFYDDVCENRMSIVVVEMMKKMCLEYRQPVVIFVSNDAPYSICEMACRATRNLSSDDETAAQLIENGIGEVLVAILRCHSETTQSQSQYYGEDGEEICSKVIESVMWAFVNLACDRSASTILGAAGACSSIIKCAKTNIVLRNPSVATSLCWALRNLASDSKFNYGLLADTDVCSALMEMLLAHRSNKEVIEAVFLTAANVFCDQTLALTLSADDLTLILTAAITLFVGNSAFSLESVQVDRISSASTDILYDSFDGVEAFLYLVRNIASAGRSNQTLLGRTSVVHFLFAILKSINNVYNNEGKIDGTEVDAQEIEVITKSQKILEVLCGVLINCTFNNNFNKAIIKELGVLQFICDCVLPKYLNFYTINNDTLNIGIIMYCVRLTIITCGTILDIGSEQDLRNNIDSVSNDNAFALSIGSHDMYKKAIETITMLRDNLQSSDEDSASEFVSDLQRLLHQHEETFTRKSIKDDCPSDSGSTI